MGPIMSRTISTRENTQAIPQDPICKVHQSSFCDCWTVGLLDLLPFASFCVVLLLKRLLWVGLSLRKAFVSRWRLFRYPPHCCCCVTCEATLTGLVNVSWLCTSHSKLQVYQGLSHVNFKASSLNRWNRCLGACSDAHRCAAMESPSPTCDASGSKWSKWSKWQKGTCNHCNLDPWTTICARTGT